MSTDDVRAYELHERLMTWLTANHPQESPLVIVSALSFEIARLVAQATEGQEPISIDVMLARVVRVMHEQITAHHAGKL